MRGSEFEDKVVISGPPLALQEQTLIPLLWCMKAGVTG
jgi:hypothetical protein